MFSTTRCFISLTPTDLLPIIIPRGHQGHELVIDSMYLMRFEVEL